MRALHTWQAAQTVRRKMLKNLKIENISVVARLEIELRPGMVAITGETGAGKSILIDALGWLCGERVPTGVVRTGCDKATIEGSFVYQQSDAAIDTNSGSVIKGANADSPADVSENVREMLKSNLEVTIHREIHASGKNLIRINGQRASLVSLRALKSLLLEIHDQGGQNVLLDRANQLSLLDSYASNEAERRRVAECFAAWRKASEELRQIQAEKLERQRIGELLKFQLEELKTIAPRPCEDEALETELQLHSNAETRALLSARLYEELLDGDESVATRLAACRKDFEKLTGADERLQTLLENLESARLQLTDVAEELRLYNSRIDFSAERLREIEERLADLERLKRKYGKDLPELEKLQNDLSARTERFDELENHETELSKRLITLRGEYIQMASILSKTRQSAIKQFETDVARELSALALGEARFVVECNSVDTKDGRAEVSADKFTASGWDDVKFLLSANPGEELQPLARVASGGELSRLMLALKIVCAKPARTDTNATLVFDEIDVGISGKTADAVGRRLARLAESQQVLCVTHQPQIAKFADQHLSISKYVEKQRTFVNVQSLTTQEQIGELARLISGDEADQTARSTAARLIQQARNSGDTVKNAFEDNNGIEADIEANEAHVVREGNLDKRAARTLQRGKIKRRA